MKLCVFGLWHLGAVTSACLAAAGFPTLGIDPDPEVIDGLSRGIPPLFEPGLAELVASGLASGLLEFSSDVRAVCDAELIWVAFDTPVDDDDHADVDYVCARVTELFPHLRSGAVVLVSSQMPVGSVGRLEAAFAGVAEGRVVSFACSPENLRLGKAIEAFTKPGRIVVGTRDDPRARAVIEPILTRFCADLRWCSIESAEMSKHALNAFLATCVTFINEIATVCEQVGADAFDVEQALRSDPRVGSRVYVSPGAAFAGGTLARDVAFLTGLGTANGVDLPLLGGILPSNAKHRLWALRRLEELLGTLSGRVVAVLGLAYKPGTDALRRSVAIELCRGLKRAGARIRAFDPVVGAVPDDLVGSVTLAGSAAEAVDGAEALIVATEWPEFRALRADDILARMARPLALDPGRFLAGTLGADPRIDYVTTGVAHR